MSGFINAVRYECYFNVRSSLMPVSCKYLHVQFHPFCTLKQMGISFTVFSCGHPSQPAICSSLEHQCLKGSLPLPATPSLSAQNQTELISATVKEKMYRGAGKRSY